MNAERPVDWSFYTRGLTAGRPPLTDMVARDRHGAGAPGADDRGVRRPRHLVQLRGMRAQSPQADPPTATPAAATTAAMRATIRAHRAFASTGFGQIG